MIVRDRPTGFNLFLILRGSVLQRIRWVLCLNIVLAILVTYAHGNLFDLKITVTPIPFTQVFQRAVSTACIGATDGAIQNFRARSASFVGKHGAKTAEDVNAQLAVSEAMMTTDQLKLVLERNFQRIVDCAKSGERMPVEERLMQRAQAAQVPKLCAEAVNEIMRACAAGGVFKTNPIERTFRDLHVARGHIANNTDTYARAHGAVMLGLPNADAFV